MQRRETLPDGGGELGERIRLTAGSHANGVCARVSVLGCRANRVCPSGTSRIAELAVGNRSPLSVRLTETAGVWLLRLAPALRNGSMPTNSAASATRPSALTIRTYNCLAIGPPPARRNCSGHANGPRAHSTLLQHLSG